MTPNNDKTIIGRHIIRYGIAADQKYLVGDFLSTYDQLVINASMIAHMPGALTSFIMERTRNKPFFIDPQTYAFQYEIYHLQNSKGKLKRSIKNLLKAYKESVYLFYGGNCKDCSTRLIGEWVDGGSYRRPKKTFTIHNGNIHHVLPIYKGGKHNYKNWVLLCLKCHYERHRIIIKQENN